MPLNLPMPKPRRHVKQILSAYDRGGHKVTSRTGQRTVARAVVRALLDGAAADAGRPPEARRGRTVVVRSSGPDREGDLSDYPVVADHDEGVDLDCGCCRVVMRHRRAGVPWIDSHRTL